MDSRDLLISLHNLFEKQIEKSDAKLVQCLRIKGKQVEQDYYNDEWYCGVCGAEFQKGGGLYFNTCLLYTSPSPRDRQKSRMPSSA